MKLWMMILAAVVTLGLTGMAEAKVHKSAGIHVKHHVPHISGKIVSISTDGTSIVIKESKKHGGQEVTITADASTKVSSGHHKSETLSYLKVGMHVKVTPVSGTATHIKVLVKHTHHKHVKHLTTVTPK